MAESFLILQFQRSKVLGLIAEPVKKKGWSTNETFSLPLTLVEDAGSNVDALSETVPKLYQSKKYNGPRHCLIVLHRQDFVPLSLEFPPGTDAETSAMLEMELPNQLPLDMAKVCYGWERVGLTSEGRQTIQVYWSPIQRIDMILGRVKKAGLEVSSIVPSLAIYRRLGKENQDKQAMESAEPLLFIHLSPESYEIASWGANGVLLFSRGKQAMRGDGDAERNDLSELQSDLLATLETYCNQAGSDRSCRVISLGSELPPLPQSLVRHEERDSAQQRIQRELEKMDDESAAAFAPLAAAVEFAVMPESQNGHKPLSRFINMLPQSVSRLRETSRMRGLFIQTLVLSAGILILGLWNLWFYTHQMESQLDWNQEEISKLKPTVQDINAMKERIQSIRDQIDYVMSPIDSIKNINAVLAAHSEEVEGLYLDHMVYKSSGQITVEGHATNDITPWRFADAVEKSGLFNIAQKPKIIIRPYGATRSIRFSLSLKALNQAENGRQEAANE